MRPPAAVLPADPVPAVCVHEGSSVMDHNGEEGTAAGRRQGEMNNTLLFDSRDPEMGVAIKDGYGTDKWA